MIGRLVRFLDRDRRTRVGVVRSARGSTIVVQSIDPAAALTARTRSAVCRGRRWRVAKSDVLGVVDRRSRGGLVRP